MTKFNLNTMSAAELMDRLKPGLQHTIMDALEEQDNRVDPEREARRPAAQEAPHRGRADSADAW